MFNIINRKSLRDYAEKYPTASNALYVWYHELRLAEFASFNELKSVYGDASVVGDQRVVFNIMGNRFRLVVRIVFEYRVVQIKWFGTNSEYDRIDVVSIQPRRS